MFTADTYSFSKFFCALILHPIELSAILKKENVLENRDEQKLKLFYSFAVLWVMDKYLSNWITTDVMSKPIRKNEPYEAARTQTTEEFKTKTDAGVKL